MQLYRGFEFDQITKDLFGNSRKSTNGVGAISVVAKNEINLMGLSMYGPDWYDLKPTDNSNATIHSVGSISQLKTAVSNAKSGDTIILTAGQYDLKSPLKITKKVIIKSVDVNNKVTLKYSGPKETPAFEMNPKGALILENIHIKGAGSQYAFASLKSQMSSLYNLKVVNSDISDFDYVLKGYKYSFSEYI